MLSSGQQGVDDTPGPGASPLEIGQIVAGKYRIDSLIGRGGMGVVLAATHLQLEHQVAIKVMRRDLLGDEAAVERLLFEARSAARVRSEHVARVLDVGTLEGGAPFIVMEYLQGENLAELLDRQGGLDVETAVEFLLECCEALAEVHVAEMVHRDLKPGNLFVARLPDGSPTVKIVDFGISKYIGGAARESGAVTSPQVLGSPFYMAPEQMRAEAVDARSDIWALGAIVFEMLSGRPPFVADTLPEVYAAVLGSAPPSLEQLRPSLPAGLEDIVQRCLQKDPAQRFCDVAELAEALAPFGRPEAMKRVERITRILANPEVIRSRISGAPGSLAASLREQSSSGVVLREKGFSTPAELGALSATGSDEALGGRSARLRRWGWVGLGIATLAFASAVVFRRAGAPRVELAEPARAVLESSPRPVSDEEVINGAGPRAATPVPPPPPPAHSETRRANSVPSGLENEGRAASPSRQRRPGESAAQRRPRRSQPSVARSRTEPAKEPPIAEVRPAPAASEPPQAESVPKEPKPPANGDPWDPKSFGGRR